jgi:hypothetical protein
LTDASSGVNVSTAGTAKRARGSARSRDRSGCKSVRGQRRTTATTWPSLAIQVDSFRRLATHQAAAKANRLSLESSCPPRAREGAQDESWVLGWPSLLDSGEGPSQESPHGKDRSYNCEGKSGGGADTGSRGRSKP